MGTDIVNTNVMDLAEAVATRLGYHFYRTGENDITMLLSKESVEYQLFMELRQDVYEALYFSCDMDIAIPQEDYEKAATAIIKANEHSWMGHFDIISSENQVMYSFTIPFASSFSFDEMNLEAIFKIILDECERFSQYFTMAMNNKDMSDLSINTLFFEALGEA